MKLKFTPQRSDSRLSVSVSGKSITVNGSLFDFAQMNDGDSLSSDAISGSLFSGNVVCIDGEIHAILSLPYGKNAGIDTMQAYNFDVAQDGPVSVPGHLPDKNKVVSIGSIDWSALDKAPAPKTQTEIDEIRFKSRASAKDGLISYMAADNVGRVRSGIWTVDNLKDLMADADIVSLLNHINTLSYELAIVKIQSLTNPLITPEIKASWNDKLSQHLYLG